MPVPAASLVKVSLIWMASSLVGLRITALTPPAGFLARIWSIGTTNARVLPVPVCAVATMSRPSRAGGMDCACTGVGVTKPCLPKLLRRTELNDNSEKVFIKKVVFACVRQNFSVWLMQPGGSPVQQVLFLDTWSKV